MIDKALEVYPEKAAKKRAPHLAPNDAGIRTACVKSNRKTIPGVMSARGCAYAGAKGVVWGPIRDMVHVSHGPVGCGWYSWGTRRNSMTGITGVNKFVRCSSPPTSRRRTSSTAATRSCKIIDEAQSCSRCQGDLGPVRMPGRPDRRRHQLGRQDRRPRRTRQSRSSRATARGSAASPSRSATTSPTTPSATTSSQDPRVRRTRADLRHRPDRRLQHRRRRLVVTHPARRDRPERHRSGPATASWRRSPPPTGEAQPASTATAP